MIAIVSGAVATGLGGAALWFCLPTNGVPAPITKKPVLDILIPIVIVSLLAVGVAMLVAGFAG